MVRKRVVGFLAPDELAEQLDRLPNKSEFIRAALLARLGCPCPLCKGSGLLPVGLGEHYASVFAAEEASGAAPRE